MESKLVISCRMMHNLIKIYLIVESLKKYVFHFLGAYRMGTV